MIFIQVMSRLLKEYRVFRPLSYNHDLKYVTEKRKTMSIYRNMTRLSEYFLCLIIGTPMNKQLYERLTGNKRLIVDSLSKIYGKLWTDYAIEGLKKMNSYEDIDGFVNDCTSEESIKDLLSRFESTFNYELFDELAPSYIIDVDEYEYWDEVIDKLQKKFRDICFEYRKLTMGTFISTL